MDNFGTSALYMSVFERCVSNWESMKRNKERQRPTLDVPYSEVQVMRELTVIPRLSLRAKGYYECGSRLYSRENRRKIEPKEIFSCLIPRLLDVFTWQLENYLGDNPES